MISDRQSTQWEDEFPLRDGLIYLNHAAVGVWPRRACEAVKTFAGENMRQGATDYPHWMQIERELRSRLQRLVNAASADDIALVKNTSEGLSLLAYGLDWQPGDNIVSTNQEFPSNRIVWESLKGKAVESRLADISTDDPEGAILPLCDTNTRLLTVSSVQYASGLRLNLERLGAFCREHGIIFCVDAIQSLGALRFDAQACHADVVVADGHKWMLGPEGLALFYIRPELRSQLNLKQYGWHMVEQVGDFDRRDWQPAKSARRFEPGSPNMLGIHALNASLSLLEDIGMDAVEAGVLNNALHLTEALFEEKQLRLLSALQADRISGIVTFRRRDLDDAGHAALHGHLMRQGVICALRGGGIRFSPHFYTPEHSIEMAVAMAAAFNRA
ncbi:MAG: aminotransferase class V-fold PLP-dependent enzyme [Mariprofundaceae bacterium]|nr:aminotransferase class V-fold PLP-dependent enzyme [Mariprofundaceae bacterium]